MERIVRLADQRIVGDVHLRSIHAAAVDCLRHLRERELDELYRARIAPSIDPCAHRHVGKRRARRSRKSCVHVSRTLIATSWKPRSFVCRRRPASDSAAARESDAVHARSLADRERIREATSIEPPRRRCGSRAVLTSVTSTQGSRRKSRVQAHNSGRRRLAGKSTTCRARSACDGGTREWAATAAAESRRSACAREIDMLRRS